MAVKGVGLLCGVGGMAMEVRGGLLIGKGSLVEITYFGPTREPSLYG